MAQVVSGVFPVYENEFTIGGKSVANLENFQLTIDNGIEEWTAMENEGWKSRLMTAKSFKIAFKGKGINNALIEYLKLDKESDDELLNLLTSDKKIK